VNNIVFQVRKPEEMPAAKKRVNEVLGARLGYDPSDERVMGTWDTVKSSKTMTNMLIGIQLFLGIIGALTLLIGLATAGILGVIGLLAGYIPARRAAAIDPAATLPYE